MASVLSIKQGAGASAFRTQRPARRALVVTNTSRFEVSYLQSCTPKTATKQSRVPDSYYHPCLALKR